MTRDRIELPECILVHDHGHDEGDCVYEVRAEAATPVAPPEPHTEARRAAFDEVLAAVEGLPRYYLGNDAEPEMVELAAVIQAVTELRDRS